MLTISQSHRSPVKTELSLGRVSVVVSFYSSGVDAKSNANTRNAPVRWMFCSPE